MEANKREKQDSKYASKKNKEGIKNQNNSMAGLKKVMEKESFNGMPSNFKTKPRQNKNHDDEDSFVSSTDAVCNSLAVMV